METHQDRLIKQKLDKIFGDSPVSAEMKQFLFLAHTGRMTDEMLEEYHRRSLEETSRMINSLEPYQSQTTESKTIYGVLASENPELCASIIENEPTATTITTTVIDNPTEAGDKDTLYFNARDKCYST